MRAPSSSVERIYVAVDVVDLRESCRDQYGEMARIDFSELRKVIPEICPDPIRQTLVAYIAKNPKQKHHGFIHMLESQGYVVCEGSAGWEVGIAIDALERIDEYDTFALVCGNSNYTKLLEYLGRKDKETMVLAFPRMGRRFLKHADHVHYLEDDVVFRAGHTPLARAS